VILADLVQNLLLELFSIDDHFSELSGS